MTSVSLSPVFLIQIPEIFLPDRFCSTSPDHGIEPQIEHLIEEGRAFLGRWIVGMRWNKKNTLLFIDVFGRMWKCIPSMSVYFGGTSAKQISRNMNKDKIHCVVNTVVINFEPTAVLTTLPKSIPNAIVWMIQKTDWAGDVTRPAFRANRVRQKERKNVAIFTAAAA